jgi:hypothetical protein
MTAQRGEGIIKGHRAGPVVDDVHALAVGKLQDPRRESAAAFDDNVIGTRRRQLCLAHLLRDAQYAIDTGDTGFAPGFYKLLQRAVAIGRRRRDLKDTTLVQYRADLDRRLDRLLAVSPTTEAGQQLARGIRKCRGDLFVFITRRDVPATNNRTSRMATNSVERETRSALSLGISDCEASAAADDASASRKTS